MSRLILSNFSFKNIQISYEIVLLQDELNIFFLIVYLRL